jgi:hypothetical protein
MVFQAFMWSLVFGQSGLRACGNAAFMVVTVLIVRRVHHRWKLRDVIRGRSFLIGMNICLFLVSIIHYRWLSEGAIPALVEVMDVRHIHWGTGLSDGLFTLDGIQQLKELGFSGAMALMYSAHLVGHILLLYPLVSVLGLDNFYAVALLNFLALMLTALVIGLVMSKLQVKDRSVPIFLFMFHPFSIIYTATIYKDPIIVLGTVLTFAGLYIQLRQMGGAPRDDRGINGTKLLLIGLFLTALMRLAYSLALFGLVSVLLLYRLIRSGRLTKSVLKPLAGIGIAIIVVMIGFERLGVLDPAVALLDRLYVSETITVNAGAGGYTPDENSIGMRYLSGPLIGRLTTLPLQIGMQLVSPFPPAIGNLEDVYHWAQQWFGVINITLSPFLLCGLFMAIRSRNGILRLIPLFGFVVLLPVLTFSYVLSRQLFPLVPFLMILAWLGWDRLKPGFTRLAAISAVPILWGITFGAYYWLRGL